MRKRSYVRHLGIPLVVIILFVLPSEPPRRWAQRISAWYLSTSKEISKEEKLSRLRIENRLLRSELESLQNGLSVAPMPSDFPLKVVPARVIMRSPTSWSSTIWISLKSDTDRVIQKNSPVLAGTSLVGVVEEVGAHSARVRLITDTHLIPSVRAKRKSSLLAKGELYGASEPLWRAPGGLLTGVGFNYDFPDDEGPARDLRTGAIIAVDDLLVTTGMDGVFPPDLEVARVVHVSPLSEGSTTYDITAKPTAENLLNLELVFVIQPVGASQETH
jgi:rod shape-determining protein MreC